MGTTGTAAGAGNLISGNADDGVYIVGSSTDSNTVQGNLIGTDASGTQALGNTDEGLELYYAPNNTIGGTDAGGRATSLAPTAATASACTAAAPAAT